MSNGWKYVGKGERISYGVPTRDIGADEFDRLNPLDQRRIEESDLYRAVTEAEAKKAEAEAKKRAEAGKQDGGDR